MKTKKIYETPEIEITRFEPEGNMMLNGDNGDNENFDGDPIYGDGPSVPDVTEILPGGGW